MQRKTIRVVSEGGRWTVSRAGNAGSRRVFASKSEAVASAKLLARQTQPSQILIEKPNRQIETHLTYGLPKIQQLPFKSRIGANRIERAVAKVTDMMEN